MFHGQRIAFRWESGNGIRIQLQSPDNEGFSDNSSVIIIDSSNPYLLVGVPSDASGVWQVLQTQQQMAGTSEELWEVASDDALVLAEPRDVSILGNNFFSDNTNTAILDIAAIQSGFT